MANDKKRKLTDKQKKKIIADYIECGNYSKVAEMNDVNASTVKRLCDSDYDKDLQEKAKRKKEENTLSTLEYMNTQHETKKRILNKLLNSIELKAEDIKNIDKMNIKDLATAYGIILDKELKVLELQKGTNNNEEINKNIQNIANLLNNPKSNRSDKDVQ